MGFRARLVCLRSECDTATDIGYLRADGVYAAVRIADGSDAQTIAGQLQVLAAQIAHCRLISPTLQHNAQARKG